MTAPPAFGGQIGRTLRESRPWWPERRRTPAGAPNVLVVLFDDVGFADFGCYGSEIHTPHIDALAAGGLRMSGFHTTAMCSTTRAALLTGRNHHSVGMGCLANFDSGFPGYRGKIAAEVPTLAERLRAQGYGTLMLGKWHVTPLSETGAGGPFDGWPLGRGFNRFYGFLDAETDQYAPELVQDNTPIPTPGSFASGYHLTADLVDQAIRRVADHVADRPDAPWFTWLALGACHAPHQAPRELILQYHERFAHGWDAERERRLARQIAMGLVPAGTQLPPRNAGVAEWASLKPDEQRLFTRLQAAYAAMLDHADQHIGRLIGFLKDSGQFDDTIILVLSDNGASQEGGPLGMVNFMGPMNRQPEPIAQKIARIDDIGGPDTHSNFPWGWAMAANTPCKRYKQNTHGGGIRDPLVVHWPKGLAARGEIRHGFCHAVDLAPTVLDLAGLLQPVADSTEPRDAAAPNAPLQRPATAADFEGQSFAELLRTGQRRTPRGPQYFEMFGHRGLWAEGWKAVAFHAPGTPFEADAWELYHLDADFAECDDRAAAEPARLQALIAQWWACAERHQVLPLDDRFGARFAENARRVQGARTRFVFHAGMGHVPTDVAPDVRSRHYRIEARLRIDRADASGVLIAHGDATSGYSLYLDGGTLVHCLNIGGQRRLLRAERPAPLGAVRLGYAVRMGDWKDLSHPGHETVQVRAGHQGMLLIDGEPAGQAAYSVGFHTMVSWSGLDIGLDRGSPVGPYEAPHALSGARLYSVTVELDPLQDLDGDALGAAEMARQ